LPTTSSSAAGPVARAYRRWRAALREEARTGRCWAHPHELCPQNLVHRPTPGQFVDQLVEVADLLHQRIVDVLIRTPQMVPVIDAACGLSRAAAKKSSKVLSEAR
jgi:hypothetical protein